MLVRLDRLGREGLGIWFNCLLVGVLSLVGWLVGLDGWIV